VIDSGALGLALVAGAVAAVNPCGFALLPAYLTLLVTGEERGGTTAVARALRFTAGMTVGFVAVFGAFGLIITPLALSIERWLPTLTIVVGVLLVGLGGWLLSGRTLALPRFSKGWAPGTSWRSQIGYGVTFALVSLSCTIAPFLAVTAVGLRGGGVLGTVSTFVTYAIGMGAVVGVLAVTVAMAGSTLATRMRRASPVISRLSGLLLVVAGGYVAWYGWWESRVLAGNLGPDPVIDTALALQTWLTDVVSGIGATGLIVLAALVASLSMALVWSRRARATAREKQDAAT
jgi:cytochrome c-type biogenesis protein